MKKSILCFLVLLIIAIPGGASGWFDKIMPGSDEFNPFILNTPQNINTLNGYMDKYNVHSVAIVIKDTGQTYYVVRGYGIVREYPGYDMAFAITRSQAKQLIEIVRDGEISWFEKIRIKWILS